jgi:hypothetical protein
MQYQIKPPSNYLAYLKWSTGNSILDKMEKEGRLQPYLPDGSKPQQYDSTAKVPTNAK